LDGLMVLSRVPVSTQIDSARMRPSETPRYVGDATLAKKVLGWVPQIELDTTLAEVLDDCRARVGRNQI
jgi:GDP-4-dehydro-6-deoxy-D-mannose reductase